MTFKSNNISKIIDVFPKQDLTKYGDYYKLTVKEEKINNTVSYLIQQGCELRGLKNETDN